MRVELLGGFRVSVGTRTVGEGAWRLKKAANLVKLLALAPGHRIHRERAMGLLWPKLGRRAAANNLYQALHAARRALEAAPEAPARYLDYRGEQLVMCPEGELWVDVEAFEEAAKAARRARRLPGGAGAVRGTPAGGPLRGVGGGPPRGAAAAVSLAARRAFGAPRGARGIRRGRRGDGIPLAIELAAARVAVLAVEQIAEKLEDALTLLTAGGRMAPPRHRTLRARRPRRGSVL